MKNIRKMTYVRTYIRLYIPNGFTRLIFDSAVTKNVTYGTMLPHKNSGYNYLHESHTVRDVQTFPVEEIDWCSSIRPSTPYE